MSLMTNMLPDLFEILFQYLSLVVEFYFLSREQIRQSGLSSQFSLHIYIEFPSVTLDAAMLLGLKSGLRLAFNILLSDQARCSLGWTNQSCSLCKVESLSWTRLCLAIAQQTKKIFQVFETDPQRRLIKRLSSRLIIKSTPTNH